MAYCASFVEEIIACLDCPSVPRKGVPCFCSVGSGDRGTGPPSNSPSGQHGRGPEVVQGEGRHWKPSQIAGNC